ncbi:hypothetical protein [Streptomyces sp. CB02923]|uniref:hypothetical protein n=1 Tax=Streptomyces sp. CB02923 TaxID=1718985 RepID=UPI0009A0CB91|nr:hypothetical protein [Streptomyces sp. CB02923]
MSSAQAAPQPSGDTAQHVTSDALPPYAVESFQYPGAEKIFKETGIRLAKGDGHIVLSQCSGQDWNIRVWTTQQKESNDYCFKATAKSGYLALKIPEVYGVQAMDRAVRATVTSDKEQKRVDVAAWQTEQVGVSDMSSGHPGKPAVLVELRVGQ